MSGCDANDGGDHSPIADDRYMFCRDCGETLRGKQFKKAAIPLNEAIAAEDAASSLEKESTE